MIENSAVVVHNPRFIEEEEQMHKGKNKGIYYYVATCVLVGGALLLILNDYRLEALLLLMVTGTLVYSEGVRLRRSKPDLKSITAEIDYCAEQLLGLEPGAIYEMPWDKDGVVHHARQELTLLAMRIGYMEQALNKGQVPSVFVSSCQAALRTAKHDLRQAYDRLRWNGMVGEGGYGPAFQAVKGKGEWTKGVTITPLPAAN